MKGTFIAKGAQIQPSAQPTPAKEPEFGKGVHDQLPLLFLLCFPANPRAREGSSQPSARVVGGQDSIPEMRAGKLWDVLSIEMNWIILGRLPDSSGRDSTRGWPYESRSVWKGGNNGGWGGGGEYYRCLQSKPSFGAGGDGVIGFSGSHVVGSLGTFAHKPGIRPN
jgi:hypothetical protein